MPPAAIAHCDTLDGPVVKAATQALSTGNLSFVLVWVQPADEPAIKAAFEKTLSVRKAGPDASSLADLYFFETVVRLHRAGEGAPYTGLKPAGSVEPAIAAADRAIAAGSDAGLTSDVLGAVRRGISHRFERLLKAKALAGEDVARGREYVRAYVDFIHYVEGIDAAVRASGAHVEH